MKINLKDGCAILMVGLVLSIPFAILFGIGLIISFAEKIAAVKQSRRDPVYEAPD